MVKYKGKFEKGVITVKHLANILTAFRLVGALVLLFFYPTSLEFYIIYSLCGLSDIFDGTVARLTKSESEFGARLDSVADLTFYSVMFIKIFPELLARLPLWLWAWVIVVVAVRASAYIVAALKYHKFASTHSLLNKATGFCVFSLPYVLMLEKAFVPFCVVTATVSLLASTQELVTHLTNKKYKSAVKEEQKTA